MQLPTLSSDRLILRPLHLEDAPAIETACNNAAVTKHLGRVPYPYPKGAARTFISRCQQGLEGVHYAITHKDHFAGVIGVAASTQRLHQAFAPSIGYWLDAPFWGKGYMSEAVTRFLNWYMPLEPTETVRSAVNEDNPRSLAILSQLGFSEIGRNRIYSKTLGHEVNQIELELTANRYYEGAK